MENYIQKKLETMSPFEKRLSEEMAQKLGDWTTINKAAIYLKKHQNTLYNRVAAGDIISRKVGNRIVVYTRSLVFMLEEE